MLWDNGLSSAEICQELNICGETVRRYLIGYENYSKKESQKRGFWHSDNTIKPKSKEKTLCNRGMSEEIIFFIKKKLTDGCNQTSLAKELNISRKTIVRINLGERYNDGGIYPIYDYKNKKSNR